MEALPAVSNARHLNGSKLLQWRRQQLKQGGRAVDFDWLLDLAGGLSWSALQRLIVDPQHPVRLQRSLAELEAIWRRHLDHAIPLQQLVGRCPWRDLELEVSSAALIPRQETELLVDLAQQAVGRSPLTRWADLGTGSGALAVALARLWPASPGHAVDLSVEALGLAERNLNALAPDAQWTVHQGSWWEPLEPWWGGFDLVLCNPPYIPNGLIAGLDPVVRDHEPELALAGGEDGLLAIRAVVDGAFQALAPGGWIVLEHHHDQSGEVQQLLRQSGLSRVGSANDLQGVERFALAQRPEAA